MDAGAYDLRLAQSGDDQRIRASVRRTLTNPEGKAQRKKFSDAIDRGELLVLTRRERDGSEAVDAFIEWHSRVEGDVTIRDTGSAGDEPNLGHIKRLIRELLRMVAPPSATVKLDADRALWNQVFQESPGFKLEGREYTRGKWQHIWTWTPANEAALRRMAGPPPRPPGRGRR